MFYKMMAKASENRIWKTKDGKGFRIQNKEKKLKRSVAGVVPWHP